MEIGAHEKNKGDEVLIEGKDNKIRQNQPCGLFMIKMGLG